MRNRKLPRVFMLIFVLIVALLVGLFLAQSLSHRGKIKINLVALPEDSQIQVDGKIKKAGANYLTPGEHKLSATREYFDEYIDKINTNNLKAGDTIYLLPVASSAQAKKWLSDNPEVQAQRVAAGGVQSAQHQDLLTKKYPFLKSLPHENSDYRIDYVLSPEDNLGFTINMFGTISGPNDYQRYKSHILASKQEAIKWLESQGVDISKYIVTYTPDIN